MISVLLARKRLALALLLGTIVAVLGVSLALPKQYTATAAVVVDMRPDPIAATISPLATNLAFVATQVDVIKSDRVLFRVMKDLALLDNPALRTQWQSEEGGKGSMQVWLAEQFKKRIEITPSRESNVIAVSYTAPDARFAAGMANALVKAYMQTSLELRVDPARQYASFFDVRSKEAREALEVAQAKLSEFQRSNGLVATDERLDIENARLAELSTQLVQLQALSAESGSRKLQSQGPQADRMQEVLNNPLISGLKADLARQETKLQELGAKFGDNHPQVQETRASIAELRTKIDQEIKRVTTSVGMSNAIQLQRDATVRADLEAQRARVLKLKSIRDEGQVLAREVENAQRTYDAIMQRLNQSSIESQATQSNIALLSEAVPPNDPSSPKMLLNSVLAVLLGLLLAVAGSFSVEALDPRVRDAADAVELLDVPLMGVLLAPGKQAAALAQPLVNAKPRST
jgi:chain length determinant protein EpsF